MNDCTEACCTAETPKGWGLHPAPGAKYHWSARAIYADSSIDILWDRMGFEGTFTEDERKALGAWLDGKALPYIRAMFAVGEDIPYQSECREVTVKGDGFTLRADPRASCGYLYLSAAPDATSTDPTPAVKPRPMNDAKSQCKACKAYSGSRHKADCTSAARVAARQAREGVRDPDRRTGQRARRRGMQD